MNVPRELAAPAARLLAAAWPEAAQAVFDPARVQVAGPAVAGGAAVTLSSPAAGAERLLVMSWIGTHPDATDPLLAALWRLEEAARATGLPVLVLRLAPLVGADAPGCAYLAMRPRLEPKLARALVQPVHEDDAVAGLAAVLAGRVAWSGWYEVCGPDAFTVGEFAEAAASGALGPIVAAPAWEPAPGVLRAMGLSEWEPWARASGVRPRPVLAGART
jgi:uncharacterized protein YbjT (DUF2867 family)